jgi:predicted AlkP superfamily phosphohydrolase/phosphomutase
VESVVIVDEEWSADRAETIPDMLVQFRKDIGVIDGCQSDRVGLIHIPVTGIRSGNHTSNHRGWVVGPGIRAGANNAARTVDIAPTLLSRIGVPIPDGVDGEAIPELGGLAS